MCPILHLWDLRLRLCLPGWEFLMVMMEPVEPSQQVDRVEEIDNIAYIWGVGLEVQPILTSKIALCSLHTVL
mgnify:CR=1 FL=1